jgi:hypothetical protein
LYRTLQAIPAAAILARQQPQQQARLQPHPAGILAVSSLTSLAQLDRFAPILARSIRHFRCVVVLLMLGSEAPPRLLPAPAAPPATGLF